MQLQREPSSNITMVRSIFLLLWKILKPLCHLSIGGTIGTTGGAATHHCRHAIQDVHDGLLELDFFDRFGNMSVYCKLDLKPVALRAYSCSRQSSSFDSFVSASFGTWVEVCSKFLVRQALGTPVGVTLCFPTFPFVPLGIAGLQEFLVRILDHSQDNL